MRKIGQAALVAVLLVSLAAAGAGVVVLARDCEESARLGRDVLGAEAALLIAGLVWTAIAFCAGLAISYVYRGGKS